MNLEGENIYNWVETVAMKAEKFIIVTPFFSIGNPRIGNLLYPIPRLKILIGDEFSTNNPRLLKDLSDRANCDVKCLYTAEFGNRLHAKVFYAIGQSGERRALVGSANFTAQGLLKNKEQAISLDSGCKADRPILDEIENWIHKLQESASEINWDSAKKEFENSRNVKSSTRDFDSYMRNDARNFWVLKTTAGANGHPYWDKFLEERVIAVGWEEIAKIMSDDLKLEPNAYTRADLIKGAKKWVDGKNDPGNLMHAAKTINWFCNSFSRGDRIILCKGYNAVGPTKVHLLGFGIVDGDVYDDTKSTWWRLKRRTEFRRMEIDVPREVLVDTLGKKTLLQTIHPLEKERYASFERWCQKEL